MEFGVMLTQFSLDMLIPVLSEIFLLRESDFFFTGCFKSLNIGVHSKIYEYPNLRCC